MLPATNPLSPDRIDLPNTLTKTALMISATVNDTTSAGMRM
jgi:hypothetical protein